MAKYNKKLITALCATAVCACLGGVTAITAAANQQATPPTLTKAHVQVLNGASIRTVSNAQGGYGIRFTGRIEKEMKENLEKYYGEANVEYGVLVCPEDFLTGNMTLDFDETDGLKAYVAGTTQGTDKFFQSVKANKVTLEENKDGTVGDYYQFPCALTDIKEQNLDREFAAAAYVGVRTSESQPFTYTVSDTFARNIYTVATYALNDETKTYDADAKAYLEGVIGKVTKEYTKTNVTIQSTTAGTSFAVGDVFTVNATVENAAGDTLETGITLSAALDSGLVEKVEKNTYKVLAMGNLNLTADFLGFNESNTALATGYSCDTLKIFNSEKTASNVVVKNSDITTIEYKNSFENVSNVLRYTNNQKKSTAGFWFTNEIHSAMKKGMYVYMDLYMDTTNVASGAVTQFAVMEHTTGVDSYTYSYQNNSEKDNFYYAENNHIIPSSVQFGNRTMANQWVRYEYCLQMDWPGNNPNYTGFTCWDSVEVPIYIANIELTSKAKSYSITHLPAELDGTFVLDGVDGSYAYVIDENYSKLTNIGPFEGKENVLRWDYSDSVLAGTTAYNANYGAIRFSASSLMKKDYYLYFDVYVTSYVMPVVFSGSTTCYLYNGANNTEASKTNYEYQIYDASGKAYETGKFNGTTFWNKWVTVEVKLTADWDSNDGLTRWEKHNGEFYLANMRISTTKLLGNA